MVDSDLESQIQFIDNYIVNNHLRYKINRLINGTSHKWSYYEKENPKEISPIKNKSLQALYQQYVDEMI